MSLSRIFPQSGAERLILLLYVALAAVMMPYHELWVDEIDSWLVARDMSLGKLLGGHTNNMGHPALWYLLLMPFAKIGLPIEAMQVVHLAIATTTVMLFLRFSPFSIATKALWAFSAPMVYEYVIISRDYCLTVLLLWTIAALYPKRMERPWPYAVAVALLFQSHTLIFGMGVTLGACYLLEMWQNRRHIVRTQLFAWLLMVAGGLAAIYQLMPPSDGGLGGLSVISNPMPVSAFLLSVSDAFLPYMYPKLIGSSAPEYLITASILLPVAILGLFLAAQGNQTVAASLFIIPFLWLWYVFSFKISGWYRYHNFILVFLLFSLWVAQAPLLKNQRPEGGKPGKGLPGLMEVVVALCLVYSCVIGGFLLYCDYAYQFSGSRNVMRFINRNHLNDRTFILYGTESINGHLPPGHTWNARTGKYVTFIKWDREDYDSQAMTMEGALQNTERFFGGFKNKVVVSTKPISSDLRQHYGLVLVFGEAGYRYTSEELWVYMPQDDIKELQ